MLNQRNKHITFYVPYTPAGSACNWLAAETEQEAWKNLMADAAHMPYKTQADFEKRGYTVQKWE